VTEESNGLERNLMLTIQATVRLGLKDGTAPVSNYAYRMDPRTFPNRVVVSNNGLSDINMAHATFSVAGDRFVEIVKENNLHGLNSLEPRDVIRLDRQGFVFDGSRLWKETAFFEILSRFGAQAPVDWYLQKLTAEDRLEIDRNYINLRDPAIWVYNSSPVSARNAIAS
jgi:hypothetical protein